VSVIPAEDLHQIAPFRQRRKGRCDFVR